MMTLPPTHPDLDLLLRDLPPDEATALRTTWALSGGADPVGDLPSLDVEAALRAFEANRSARPTPRRLDAPPVARAGRRRAVLRWSAVAAVVMALGVATWWLRPIEHAVPFGETLSLTLPDGSQVELNSGSRLRYARHFGDVRAVHLTGEAFFDVHSDQRPFVVETFDARIRVLGTRFSVRVWPERAEAGTLVALVTGEVAVTPLEAPARARTLAPGETHQVGADAAPTPLSVDDATAWRHGDFVFKDQRLDVILREVGRRYAISVRVQPASLEAQRLNVSLRRPAGAEAVLRDLAIALDARFRATSDGYELYRELP